MNQPIAKPIVKNKFWVVENRGQKIATIQARDNGGFVYVHDEQREFFPSVKILKQKYKIKFGSIQKINKLQTKTVYGFPVTSKAFNEVWDIQRKLPIYSKSSKSKSLFCAGYYVVKLNGDWSIQHCPKNITLSRYSFNGPYKTKEEALQRLEEIKCKS